MTDLAIGDPALTDLALVLAGLLFAAGGVFTVGAGLGMIRLPDVYMRMHASTKAGTLGVGLILLGVAVYFGTISVVARALAAITFIFITAPVAAHMMSRAAYRSGVPMWSGSVADEYQGRDRPESAGPASGGAQERLGAANPAAIGHSDQR
ncbi:MAG: Na+/H+ antiporter subunit G [Azospirillum sp.]|nr:Na+/H+ antiporter subunit G [Azospirillum sp.]